MAFWGVSPKILYIVACFSIQRSVTSGWLFNTTTELSCGFIIGPMQEVINLVPQITDLRPLGFSGLSYVCTLPPPTDKESCGEYSGANHVRPVNPGSGDEQFYVYYEEENYVVIQRRTELSLNFNRSWTDYFNGFGDLHGDHWLGLKKIFLLTEGVKNRYCKLSVQFEDGDVLGITFRVKIFGNMSGSFRHFHCHPCIGPLRDQVRPHNGVFVAPGQPHRTNSTSPAPTGEHCADVCGGGWWYSWNSGDTCGGNINTVLTAPTSGTEYHNSYCGWGNRRVVKTLMTMRLDKK